jgi:hypothetical protein
MGTEIAAERALLATCGVVRREDWRGREGPLGGLDEAGWRRLVAHASYHGLAGLVSRNLDWVAGAAAPPAVLVEELRALRRRVLARNLSRRASAREAAEALAREGIPFVVLKGSALAEESYGDLSLRGFNDFDVMVPRESVEAAYRVARELGYALIRFTHVRDWIRAGAHAAGMSRRDGASLDIHWTLAPELAPEAVDFAWRHCVPPPAGATLPGLRLAPELALVHLAKHFHTSQYCLLKPLVDFHFTARSAAPLDAAAVRRAAEALGLATVVEVAAALAQRTLGTPVSAAWFAGARPSVSARLATRLIDEGLLVAAADRSRLGNWVRYLATAGGPRFTARALAKDLFPPPLALSHFFNAPFTPGMYPSYYWRQLVKVLTLSTK